MTLTILRPITVRARVTDALKARLTAECRAAMAELDEDLRQIEIQGKRAQLSAQLSPQQQVALRQALENERLKRLDQKAELEARIKDIGNLTLGSEIVQGTVQGPVEVAVGADWDHLMQVEVLLEDGRVVAVRGG